MRLILLFIACFLYALPSLAQNRSEDTPYLSTMKMYIPREDTSFPSISLLTNSVQHKKTPGRKLRPGCWINLDYSSEERGGLYFEDRFVYCQSVEKDQSYDLYYKGTGNHLLDNTVREISFTKFSDLVKKLSPYRIQLPTIAGKNPYEVYRWHHPNLHVVFYDKKRGGYFSYRIALVMYLDMHHPKALRFFE